MGLTQFNAAIGESQEIGDWRAAEAIVQWLDELPHEANSGDIYALTGRELDGWRADLACCSLLSPCAAAHAADALAVDVVNASEPTLCAEKDNVYLKLQSGEARRFTVEAAHPAYIGTIVVDRWAPDFTNCDMSSDPSFKFEKRRLTIYETEEWQLVGLTFPSFWRPNQVPVRVGNRIETGFHLLQLWTRHQERAEEVLVLYPADGYWRARPLPPQNLRWSAYGSSFLIGPVEVDGRPFVDIRDIAFDPATRTFTLNFVRGGSATLRLDKLDQERIVLDVNARRSRSRRIGRSRRCARCS